MHNKLVLSFRKEYYFYILQLPIQFFSDFPTGKISQRVFEDIELICATVVNSIINTCVEVVKLLIIIIILFIVGIKFLVLFAVMALLYLINLSIFKTPIESTSRAVGAKMGELYSKLYDTIPGIKEIKNYTTEKTESKIFIRENCTLFRFRIKNFIIASSMNMVAETIPAVGAFFAFLFTVNEYLQGNISLGLLVLIMSYLQMLRGPIEVLVGVATSLKQGLPAIDRIEEINRQKTENYMISTNTHNSCEKKEFIPRIEFKNVCFYYPSSDSKSVLKNIDLNIEAGQSVALVGHTGAGKTTITSLILKYYMPSSGRIYISDIDIENYAVNELRKHIAVVPQHPHIFYSTIEDNIKYGKSSISREEVIEVCSKIKLHEFIISLPEGYDSILGERGVKLSGGQKQLIAIARAMLKNLPILILDEATSSLDSHTESVIKDALNQLIKNRTTIAIAHRLSTIINSDEIVIIEHGEIKERGKHDELLKHDGPYAKLYKEQFRKEYVKNI